MATSNMMNAQSNEPQILVAQTLPTSSGILISNNGGKAIVVKTASVFNTTTNDHTAFVKVTRSNGSTVFLTAARLRGAEGAEPGESGVIDELFGFCLGPGDSISGYSTGLNSIDITLSGAVSS